MPDSIVIIPTYNEKENIERMIRRVFSLPHDFHILVIDDGSPDGTQNIVKQLQLEFPDRLFIEEREGKQGNFLTLPGRRRLLLVFCWGSNGIYYCVYVCIAKIKRTQLYN